VIKLEDGIVSILKPYSPAILFVELGDENITNRRATDLI
jgi:hypothetical protein